MGTVDLRPLGRAVAGASDEALALRRRPPVAERLARIRAAEERRAARQGSLRRPIAAGVAVGAVAAAALLWPRPQPLQVFVGEPAAGDYDGGYAPKPPLTAARDALAWVAAPPGTTVPIGFSDGSRVLLSGGARARVVGVTEHGARVVVERGSVRADVVPRKGNDWSVIGGPFEVHVTGTSFDAGWDPDREELRVAVHHGSVVVRGVCLTAARPVTQGEAVTVSCVPPQATPPAPSPTLAPAAPGIPRASGPAPAPAPSPPASESAAAPPASWRDLARAGAYKQAIAAAEAEGFDHLCDDLPAADLMDLASAARLGGRPALASQAYAAVRRRFPGTDQAATAAFRLGQLAFDGAHAFAEARRWFLTYLAERPGGALEAEALGRALEAEQRLGDLPAARATAAKYLARHPQGAHAALARSVLAP